MPRVRPSHAAAAPKDRKPSKKERAAFSKELLAQKACASVVEAQCLIIAGAYKVLKEKIQMHGMKRRFMDSVSASGESDLMAGTVGILAVERIGSNANKIRKLLEENENAGE